MLPSMFISMIIYLSENFDLMVRASGVLKDLIAVRVRREIDYRCNHNRFAEVTSKSRYIRLEGVIFEREHPNDTSK